MERTSPGPQPGDALDTLALPASEPPEQLSTRTKHRLEGRARRVCLAWVEACDEPVEGIARTVDLSARGLGLVLSRPISPGTGIRVQIQLEANSCLQGHGEVVHSTALANGLYRLGVELGEELELIDNPSHVSKVI